MGEKNRSKASTSGFNLKRFRQVVYAEVASGTIFFVSALPFTWVQDGLGSFLRFDSWYLVFIVFFVMLTIARRVGGQSAEQPV